MNTTNQPQLRAFAAIDTEHLRANFDALSTVLPEGKKVLAVVKAGAYGHDAAAVAHALSSRAAYFGVATATEGKALRDSGISEPILIFGRTPLSQAQLLAQEQLTQCVFSYDYARLLSETLAPLGGQVKIHIKIDTGMGRLGFRYDDETLVSDIQKIAAMPALQIEGIFSHYAKSDVPADPFNATQRARFCSVTEQLEATGIRFPWKHMANSAASLLGLPDDGCNLVRAGICLYGDFPSADVRALWNAAHPTLPLLPVMRLCATVAQIRTLRAGEPLGYDCAFVAERDSVIAVVAAGYADGVPRAISKKADAICRGCRIVGNVCMDMTFVDITDCAECVREGDTVTLFGDGGILAADWATAAGTIPYEIYCNISARIPRVIR